MLQILHYGTRIKPEQDYENSGPVTGLNVTPIKDGAESWKLVCKQ